LSIQHDLVIRGGDIADGFGAPLRIADIAISNGIITAVGEVGGRGKQEIDARGKLVTPGFVDIHTHYDGQAMWTSQLSPSSSHGVTTAVMGNCGVGFAPVRPAKHRQLVELMEGVEDIPGVALEEGLTWDWETFPQYMDALERNPRDMDIAAHLPHSALRLYVMGSRASRLEMATPQDIAEMRALATEAIKAGAIGFSTSRTLNHRTLAGESIPTLKAAGDELMGIALGLRDAGAGVLQVISDFEKPDLEFQMLRGIVEASGRPMSISMIQRHSDATQWRKLLKSISEAAAAGLPMRAQVAPRPVGILLGLQGSRNPFVFCPSYQAVAKLPLSEKVRVLRTGLMRKRLLDELVDVKTDDPLAQRMTAFEHIFPFGDPPDYEPPQSSSLAAEARRTGRKPAELAYDYLLEQDGRAFLFAPFGNFAHFNLDDTRDMIASPHTLIGLGDGGAHVSIISDGSFPTYLLTHWGRDRAAGRFDLSWLVRRQTFDNARAVGLEDRGVLAVGKKADVNVIDFENLKCKMPHMVSDLPAGGQRLLQGADGYVATIVSGEIVASKGKPTGNLPGRLIRMHASAPG